MCLTPRRPETSVLVTPLHPGTASRRARAFVREVLEAEGVPGDDISDTETIVAELAANCERHGRPPYEMRVFSVDGVPTWCEVVDSDPDLHWIPAVLTRPRDQTIPDLFSASDSTLLSEDGRGLLLVRELSQGHCRAYLTTTFATDTPAKAIAFALPTRSGTRLTCHPSCT
ncbi:ATP-binding protein [Sphaerisporangium sp. NPDC088356]|uniref:ATP-binding protein n=1 Tax=Sphaerisporangium sp. NPDC088356 TaxID=3154871 RepID=UPI003438A5C9